MSQHIEELGTLVDLSALKARLGKTDPEFLNFNFQVGSAAYRGQVNTAGEPPMLLLLAEFGSLPFSIEGAGKRQHALDVLEYAKNFFGSDKVRLGISKTQSLFLLGRAELTRPVDVRQILLTCCHLVAESHVPVCLLRDHAPQSFIVKKTVSKKK